MEKSTEERLLALMLVIRGRLERDLEWLAAFSREHPEHSTDAVLEELHVIYKHYIRLAAFTTNPALKSGSTSAIHTKPHSGD